MTSELAAIIYTILYRICILERLITTSPNTFFWVPLLQVVFIVVGVVFIEVGDRFFVLQAVKISLGAVFIGVRGRIFVGVVLMGVGGRIFVGVVLIGFGGLVTTIPNRLPHRC